MGLLYQIYLNYNISLFVTKMGIDKNGLKIRDILKHTKYMSYKLEGFFKCWGIIMPLIKILYFLNKYGFNFFNFKNIEWMGLFKCI